MTTEHVIQGYILKALGQLEGCKAFRLNVGLARDRRGHAVRFGVPGMADILVLVGPVYLWLEVKAPSGRQSKQQKAFQKAVESIGGLYRVVKSVDEALAAVEEARR